MRGVIKCIKLNITVMILSSYNILECVKQATLLEIKRSLFVIMGQRSRLVGFLFLFSIFVSLLVVFQNKA